MKTIKWPILCLMITLVVISSLLGSQSSSARGYYQTDNPTVILAEGDDYATRILRDAWDMSEYSDISQYINQSGQASIVKNIQVNDGVFSATSVGNSGTGNNGYFFLLFPGYLTAVHTGKAGSHYPINSSKYHCMYVAMQVDSPPPGSLGNDGFNIFWFHDQNV